MKSLAREQLGPSETRASRAAVSAAAPAGDLYLTVLVYLADRARRLGAPGVARRLLAGQAQRLLGASPWLRVHWLWLASIVWRLERPRASEALLWRALAGLGHPGRAAAPSVIAGLVVDLTALCLVNGDRRRLRRLRRLLLRLAADPGVRAALRTGLERARQELPGLHGLADAIHLLAAPAPASEREPLETEWFIKKGPP